MGSFWIILCWQTDEWTTRDPGFFPFNSKVMRCFSISGIGGHSVTYIHIYGWILIMYIVFYSKLLLFPLFLPAYRFKIFKIYLFIKSKAYLLFFNNNKLYPSALPPSNRKFCYFHLLLLDMVWEEHGIQIKRFFLLLLFVLTPEQPF